MGTMGCSAHLQALARELEAGTAPLPGFHAAQAGVCVAEQEGGSTGNCAPAQKSAGTRRCVASSRPRGARVQRRHGIACKDQEAGSPPCVSLLLEMGTRERATGDTRFCQGTSHRVNNALPWAEVDGRAEGDNFANLRGIEVAEALQLLQRAGRSRSI